MLIQQYKHQLEGYNPILNGPKWQVTQHNDAADLNPNAIAKIDKYLKTNETFLQLVAQEVIIAAEITAGRHKFEAINMKPEVLNNIPNGYWQNIAMSADTDVLVTEDAYTHLDDNAYHHFNNQNKEELKQIVKSDWYN